VQSFIDHSAIYQQVESATFLHPQPLQYDQYNILQKKVYSAHNTGIKFSNYSSTICTENRKFLFDTTDK